MKLEKRSSETLCHENYEDRLRRAKLRIRQKGAWYAVEHTAEEYAWIIRHEDAIGKKGEKASSSIGRKATVDPSKIDSIEELTSPFSRQGDCWNIEKRKRFDQWDAQALGIMMERLDTDDAALIDEFETAAAVWTQLKIKYFKTNKSTTTKSTARINMSAIQNFKYTSGFTIDGSWLKLKEYRRKIIAANKAHTSSLQDDVLFHILTSALYKADIYVNALDGFMALNLSDDECLKILQEKESQVKEAKNLFSEANEEGFPLKD